MKVHLQVLLHLIVLLLFEFNCKFNMNKKYI